MTDLPLVVRVFSFSYRNNEEQKTNGKIVHSETMCEP